MGLPPQFENGNVAEDLLSNRYGHTIHFWDLRARKVVKSLDLGENHQMALEIRPAHDPVPADADDLPDLLKGFGAVLPLVTDIDLSKDDKYLYVACWVLGEMHQTMCPTR